MRKRTVFFSPILGLLLWLNPAYSSGQNFALVNNGAQLYVQGPGALASNSSMAIHGSFVNLTDLNGNDGSIELNKGNIWIDSNWTNNAMNNVFTNNSGSNQDGYVIFENTGAPQYISGITPTYFENVLLKSNRKILLNDNWIQKELRLDAILELNGNTLVLNDPNPSDIFYISGFIKSETLPGNYGFLRWNIGSSLGQYSIPFGSDNTLYDDLRYFMDIKSPMNNSDYISYATYPADVFNQPLPTGAGSFQNENIEVRKVVDRYWIIHPSPGASKPLVDMTFTYTGRDVDGANNDLKLKRLRAMRYNPVLGKWLDMYPRGKSASNTVTIENVSGNDLFEPWTLVNIPKPVANVFVPDAFTPNHDGLNDVFIPVPHVDFQVNTYELFIYNRWGQLVFHTKDIHEGWNGKINNKEGQPVNGVYSWVVLVSGSNVNDKEGDVTYSEKLTGRVVLYE